MQAEREVKLSIDEIGPGDRLFYYKAKNKTRQHYGTVIFIHDQKWFCVEDLGPRRWITRDQIVEGTAHRWRRLK